VHTLEGTVRRRSAISKPKRKLLTDTNAASTFLEPPASRTEKKKCVLFKPHSRGSCYSHPSTLRQPPQ
jgi:hypothetical protein